MTYAFIGLRTVSMFSGALRFIFVYFSSFFDSVRKDVKIRVSPNSYDCQSSPNSLDSSLNRYYFHNEGTDEARTEQVPGRETFSECLSQ